MDPRYKVGVRGVVGEVDGTNVQTKEVESLRCLKVEKMRKVT